MGSSTNPKAYLVLWRLSSLVKALWVGYPAYRRLHPRMAGLSPTSVDSFLSAWREVEERENMRRFSLLCVLAVALCAVATADVIPTWQSVTPAGGGLFTWTYDVNLTLDQKLIGGLSGSLPASVSPGNTTYAGFFTIYDFSGFNGVTTAPAGWVFMSQNTGITPSDVLPNDSGSIANLTWAYTGTATLTGPQDLGLFTAQSIYGLTTPGGFTARAFRSTGDNVGTVVDNIGSTTVPNVPEPATMALIGAGLLGLGLLRRRARKS